MTRAEKERQEWRKKLEAKFPGGIAEVQAITEKRVPMVDNPTELQKRRAPATSIMFRVEKKTGTTNIMGGATSIPHVIEMFIYPNSGRTDRFPEGKAWFPKPLDVLEYLADKAKGWGTIYRLVPVEAEIVQIEEASMTDPVSRKLFGELKSTYGLKSNEEIAGVDKKAVERLNRDAMKDVQVEVIEEDYEDEDDDNIDPNAVLADRLQEELEEA